MEKNPVLLYFILVTDANIRCLEIAFIFLLRQREKVSVCRSHTPEGFPGSILLKQVLATHQQLSSGANAEMNY